MCPISALPEAIEIAQCFERDKTRFSAMITRFSNYIPAISCQPVLLVSACKEPVAALFLSPNRLYIELSALSLKLETPGKYIQILSILNELKIRLVLVFYEISNE